MMMMMMTMMMMMMLMMMLVVVVVVNADACNGGPLNCKDPGALKVRISNAPLSCFEKTAY